MKTEHARFVTLIGAALCALLGTGCSTMELKRSHSFYDWYIGKPGFDGAFGQPSIREDRPPIFGHLRFPEVAFQPVGGIHYPARRANTERGTNAALEAYEQSQRTGQAVEYQRETYLEEGHENSLAFDLMDAGLIEVIPYRLWASDASVGEKIGYSLLQPGVIFANACMSFVRLPVYAYLDIDKTLAIPIAAIYYAGDED